LSSFSALIFYVCGWVFASDRHTNIRFRPMVDKSDQQCKSTRVYK
jgi:hypothetical protein